MEKPPDRDKPSAQSPSRMGGLHLGLQFGITAVGGLALGYWLDGKFLPSPLGTLGGLFAGAGIGMYILVREVKK